FGSLCKLLQLGCSQVRDVTRHCLLCKLAFALGGRRIIKKKMTDLQSQFSKPADRRAGVRELLRIISAGYTALVENLRSLELRVCARADEQLIRVDGLDDTLSRIDLFDCRLSLGCGILHHRTDLCRQALARLDISLDIDVRCPGLRLFLAVLLEWHVRHHRTVGSDTKRLVNVLRCNSPRC